MPEETHIQKPFLTVVEVAVAFIGVGIVSLALSSSCGFSGFWTVIPLAILAAGLGVTALIKSHIAPAVAFGLIAVLIGVINAPTIPKLFPLRYPVQQASFHDATVADILLHIARSNDDRPFWRFHVSDQQLAYTRVTMTIPADASLGDTLDLLMARSGASYTWCWHKVCSNERSPLCASFYVTRDVSRDRFDNEVAIDPHGIYDLVATAAAAQRAESVGRNPESASVIND